MTDALYDSVFMRACRREPVPYTPVWLMRQAGRYMQEYRDVRARHSFLELCKNPELASEVTVYAANRLRVDAAIIFADILLVVEPLGLRLEFAKGEGPVIHDPVRTSADVERISADATADALSYVYDAIRFTRRDLPARIPLIGFCGAPFTVASYMIEGAGSRNYIHTKRLMYTDAGAWHELMRRISRLLPAYLNEQIEAGAQAVQIFDSWVGNLSPSDYREYVLPHTRSVIERITPGVPVIHFGTGTATLLEDMQRAGGGVIGVDYRTPLGAAWDMLNANREVAIMGNLDPVTLFATPEHVEREAGRILDEAAGRPGHIFNLGHGILPETPVDNVVRLVEFVHESSAERRG